MLRLFAPAGGRQVVDGGQVFCPNRGHDVECDLCAGCPRLVELRLDARPAFVRCEADAALSPLA